MIIRCTTILCFLTLLIGCDEQKPPSRDQIPVLRQRLFDLGQAIAARSAPALDSMMSVDILDYGLSSDSLLRFIYGPQFDNPFMSLGDYRILYNDNIAVIECYAMDTSGQAGQPVKLLFKSEDDIWLLTKFESFNPDSTGSQ